MKTGHDIIVTPRAIYWADGEDYNYCDYIAEGDKEILLKCKYEGSLGDLYHMFYIKGKFSVDDWDDNPDNDKCCCEVYECVFEIKDGVAELEDIYNSPYPWTSCHKEDLCKDEKVRRDFKQDNCYDEIKKRGWEKYLPAVLKE